MAQIGAKNFYWNGIKSESATTVTYAGTTDSNYGGALIDLVQANVTLNFVEGEAYADDKQVDDYYDFNYADIALQSFDLPVETQGVWFGGTVSTSELTEGGNDSPTLIGCGYARTLRKKDSNGKVQTIWRGYFYPKVKPRRATNENGTTKGSSTSYNYDEYTLRATETNGGGYRKVEDFTSESAFVTWIKGKLSLT